MEKSIVNRTSSFRWCSKQDLYSYFKKHYKLEQANIDNEILKAMNCFQPRKGQAIKTTELWQKVGLNLEKKYGIRNSGEPIDIDLGIMDTVAEDENDPNRTRRMPAIPEHKNIDNRRHLISEMVFCKKNAR